MNRDIGNIRNEEVENIAGIKEKAEKDKKQIDAGNPKPADIFNREIEEKK
jgi:hypothetical protein